MSQISQSDSDSDSSREPEKSPPHWAREHYIPLRKRELVERLLRDGPWTDEQREQLHQLAHLMDALLHNEFHSRVESLKNLYAPFDPDGEAPDHGLVDDDARLTAARQMFEEFDQMMMRANYHRLSRSAIDSALAAASHWGVTMDVEFGVFRRLAVYGRGDVIIKHQRRNWRRRLRLEEIEVPIYQRLVVLFQLRRHQRLGEDADTSRIFAKLFKNIPKADMDKMLPGSRVRITVLDQGKILVPTLSGLAFTLFKLVKAVLAAAVLGVYGLLVVLGLVGGTIGYGIKSFLGYQRTRDRYNLDLTRNLYYQNLDKNEGVLHRLSDEAEEQEFREAFLAYCLLCQHAETTGWTASELDQRAEERLVELTRVDVDFEISDALAKLDRFGLVEKTGENCWKAIPLRAAVIQLDRMWDGRFRYAEDAGRHADES